MNAGTEVKLSASFRRGVELVVSSGDEELVFIQVDENDLMSDAWYRHSVSDFEHNTFCEEIIKDLFVNEEPVTQAIGRFGGRVTEEPEFLFNDTLEENFVVEPDLILAGV